MNHVKIIKGWPPQRDNVVYWKTNGKINSDLSRCLFKTGTTVAQNISK
jgi:hypothetical protein